MRRASAAALLLVAFAGCATDRGHDNDPPSLVPPPDVNGAANTAVSDARLTEMQVTLTEMLERMDVLNARIARLESPQTETRAVPAARVQEPAPTPAPAVAAAPAPATTHAPAPTPITQPSAPSVALQSAAMADSYRSALILYGKGRLTESRAALQHVFDADPSGELADNALYWIGETYFAANDYSTAMRFYERVTREYPESNKAPDAMLKIGLTHAKTGDLGMARRTFDDLTKRYPYSTAASAAKTEMKRIRY